MSGLVRTEIHAAAGDPGRLERVTDRVPLGRPGEPEDIAGAIAWLFPSKSTLPESPATGPARK